MMMRLLKVLLLLALAAFFPDTTSGFGPIGPHKAAQLVENNNGKVKQQQPFAGVQRAAASAAMAFFLLTGNVAGDPSSTTTPLQHLPGGVAQAAESRMVGEIKGSGLVFKDTLNVESFDDPKVRGVTLYISNFQRPLTERLQKDFFSDPSFASVGCAKTAKKVEIADNIAIGSQGEEVFEESRSLLFKTLRVQRIYDNEKNTVVYVSFNTRLDKNSDSNKSRFKSSICAVNLD